MLMVSLSACEYEDDFPAGVGEGNIEAIVLNEGRIGTNMGAISVLYRNGMVSPDVFRVVNNRPLGDVAQSITMINGKYFIALNNSKKIEIVISNPKVRYFIHRQDYHVRLWLYRILLLSFPIF